MRGSLNYHTNDSEMHDITMVANPVKCSSPPIRPLILRSLCLNLHPKNVLPPYMRSPLLSQSRSPLVTSNSPHPSQLSLTPLMQWLDLENSWRRPRLFLVRIGLSASSSAPADTLKELLRIHSNAIRSQKPVCKNVF